MKILGLIGFNVFALYLLGAFIFSDGGIINNTRKMNLIYELRVQKMEEMIDLEEMEYELNHLSSMESPDPNLLARRGEKYENTVIFKFEGESENEIIESEPADLKKITDQNEVRIYVMLGMVVIMLIGGNVLLIWKLARV